MQANCCRGLQFNYFCANKKKKFFLAPKHQHNGNKARLKVTKAALVFLPLQICFNERSFYSSQHQLK